MILFEVEEENQSNLLADEWMNSATCREYDLTYTIHLPLDLKLGQAEQKQTGPPVVRCG